MICCCLAQTITTTDANDDTIVEVVSTNPLGVATTQILSTLTTTTTTTPTPPQTQQQGPVGAPGQQATGTGPTPYIYTTLINGVFTAVSDEFTPTFPATLPPSIGPSGTEWNYADWSKIYATATQNTAAQAISRPSGSMHSLIASGVVCMAACLWVWRLV